MNVYGAKVELSITHEDGAQEKISFWASTLEAKLDPKPEPMGLLDFSMECTELSDIQIEREAVPIPPVVHEAAQRIISRIFNNAVTEEARTDMAGVGLFHLIKQDGSRQDFTKDADLP